MKLPTTTTFALKSEEEIANEMISSALVAAADFCDEFEIEPMEDVDSISAGASFIIPVAVPTGTPSGDGRVLKPGSLSIRDLPLALLWQFQTGDGHAGSVVVGRIDSADVTDAGVVNVRGVFDTGPYGREVERLIRGRFLQGVSVDLDQFEAQVEDDEDTEMSEKNDNRIKNKTILIDQARVMAITVVSKPAFGEAKIFIEDEPTLQLEDDLEVPDGVYEELPEDDEQDYATILASAAPVVPPREWFSNPGLNGPTPLNIDDDGKVYGHIATWNSSHIGMMGRRVHPPRSSSKYAYFRTGVVRTDDGTDVQVGQLTLTGGHATLQASADEAKKHYDDTASSVADVVVGEDQFGIWVAGALRPDLTPAQVRAFRASAPSGDWRPINGQLELVAVCAVNVPGFPTVRAIVAGGQITALVAAGTAELVDLKQNAEIRELNNKISNIHDALYRIEHKDELAEFNAAVSELEEFVAEHDVTLAEQAEAAVREFFAEEIAEKEALYAEFQRLSSEFEE